MGRFKAFLTDQKVPVTEAEWADAQNQADMRDQVAFELQNVAFGVEAGFRYLSEKDPQVQKALAVLPEAGQLVQRKQAAARAQTAAGKQVASLR